jgi:hypothetical protein
MAKIKFIILDLFDNPVGCLTSLAVLFWLLDLYAA